MQHRAERAEFAAETHACDDDPRVIDARIGEDASKIALSNDKWRGDQNRSQPERNQ